MPYLGDLVTNIEKILAVIAGLVLICVIALPLYEQYGRQNVVLLITLQDYADPFETIPHSLPSRTVLLNVKQVDRDKNQYLVTVNTQKKRMDLVDWMLKSHKVEKIQVQELSKVRP
jgi:hypothetical protein